jgi:hypothetical protein
MISATLSVATDVCSFPHGSCIYLYLISISVDVERRPIQTIAYYIVIFFADIIQDAFSLFSDLRLKSMVSLQLRHCPL